MSFFKNGRQEDKIYPVWRRLIPVGRGRIQGKGVEG
jgi:hypothetical protein